MDSKKSVTTTYYNQLENGRPEVSYPTARGIQYVAPESIYAAEVVISKNGCLLTRWWAETPAENVSGGHTVEFYGVVITGAFTLTSTILSLGLAWVHMTHYSKPNEQKQFVTMHITV
jgi:Organic solute transporter Ostalpha